jgi:hypothetical protein
MRFLVYAVVQVVLLPFRAVAIIIRALSSQIRILTAGG